MSAQDASAAAEAAETASAPPPARIAVIGAGWWAQTRHLPHLSRNADAEIAAIVEPCGQPTAPGFLARALESRAQLGARYAGVPVFASVDALLADAGVAARVDGAVVCTPHAAHVEVGVRLLAAGKHVLMEKPMAAEADGARALAKAAKEAAAAARGAVFMVNHTANFRARFFEAREVVASGGVGVVQHVLCVMYAPLRGLFEDSDAGAWVEASEGMAGNGFGWGQLGHALAWALAVSGLEPADVTATTARSAASGADVMDAALVRCAGGAALVVSGGCGVPGDEYAAGAGAGVTGKHFDVRVFGTEGVLEYGGNDQLPASGRLALRRHDGGGRVWEGFEMEDTEEGGVGPESLRQFVAACRGLPHRNGADADVGLRTVRVIDAMYRSARSGAAEPAG